MVRKRLSRKSLGLRFAEVMDEAARELGATRHESFDGRHVTYTYKNSDYTCSLERGIVIACKLRKKR